MSRVLASVCALALCFLSVSTYAQQPKTVQQGVYTSEQANRGQAIYKDRCASCHGETLGGGLGPPLSGDDFISRWNKQPLAELFSKIRNTMPQNDPGKLSGKDTAAIVADILRAGKFPAGQAEVGADEDALKEITWPVVNTAPANSTSTSTQSRSFPPAGNLAQVMRGILFPSSNIIFNAQTHDPGAPKPKVDATSDPNGVDWLIWGGSIYSGWELVDYAAVSLAESAPLLLTPGRRCENGKPVPVDQADWIKFTEDLAEAGRAAYKASQSRNQDVVADVSNQVSDACLNCHQVYRDKRGVASDPNDPSNKALRCFK